MSGLTITPEPGVCFQCGCTDDTPCIDPQVLDPCFWANDEETFCSWCATLYGLAVLRGGSPEAFDEIIEAAQSSMRHGPPTSGVLTLPIL